MNTKGKMHTTSRKINILTGGAFALAIIVLAFVMFLMLRDDNHSEPDVLHIGWLTLAHNESKTAALQGIFMEAIETSGCSDTFKSVEIYDILTTEDMLDGAIFGNSDYQLFLMPSARGESFLEQEFFDICVDFTDAQPLLDAGIEGHSFCLIDWESMNKAPKGQTDKLLAILEAIKR